MAKSSNYATGIDFSDRSIQIVELEYKKTKLKSVLYESVELPAGVVEFGEIVDQTEFDSQLNQLLDKAERQGFTFENIVLSLPEEYLKVISVEVEGDVEDAQIDELIFEKIKDELLEVSESWKYEIFEIDTSHTKKYLFLGIETERLLSFTRNAAEFGIEVSAVEPDSFSLLRHVPEDGPQVVIDFGEHKTILYFMFDGLLHKRFILEYGANEIMSQIADTEGLKREKEEKMFRKIGYGKRTTKKQKEIIEGFFKNFSEDFKRFIKDVESDYDVEFEEIYMTGGLSSLKGIKSLFPNDYRFKVLAPILKAPEVSKENLNSVGAALSLVYEGLKVNFLTTDIKQDIESKIEELMQEKEEELLKRELERLTRRNRIGSPKLKETFESKWGEKEGSQTKWGLSFKFTSIFQLFIVFSVGLGIVAATLFMVNNDNFTILKEEEKIEEAAEVRDYFTSKFDLAVLGGNIEELENTATMLGRFEEYVFEYQREYEVEGDSLSQEQIDKAAKELKDLAISGFNHEEYLSLDEDRYLIPSAVSYESALEGADTEVGVETDTFTFTLRAIVKFAIVNEERLDQILDQHMIQSLRPEEQLVADDYEVLASRIDFVNFDEDAQTARFNVSFEVRK